jgi:hypothetical protein
MSPKGDPKGGRPLKDPAGPSKMQSYRLPPATIAAIKEGAVALGVSQADLIDFAVREYLAAHHDASPPFES